MTAGADECGHFCGFYERVWWRGVLWREGVCSIMVFKQMVALSEIVHELLCETFYLW